VWIWLIHLQCKSHTKTLTSCIHNDRSSNAPQAGLKLLKTQKCHQHPPRIRFIIPGWKILISLDEFIVIDGKMGKFKHDIGSKKITIYKQQQALSEFTKSTIANDMLRSFGMENNSENIEKQEDNLFEYSLQLTALLTSYSKRQSHNTADNTMSTCVWQRL
jgi:hypothetical protein